MMIYNLLLNLFGQSDAEDIYEIFLGIYPLTDHTLLQRDDMLPKVLNSITIDNEDGDFGTWFYDPKVDTMYYAPPQTKGQAHAYQ